MDCEKIFVKYVSDKGLVSEYAMYSCNLIVRQTTQLKMGRRIEKTFR